MKSANLSFLAATCAAIALSSSALADEPGTIKFSDPNQPGTVKINLGRGELTIKGSDIAEVIVKTDARVETATPRKDGLRVISAGTTFSLQERDNVVTLDAAGREKGRGSGDYNITVPRNTTVIVQNAWGGDISCVGVAGDIEINCMHGAIRLEDVRGGVVASTMNGEIRANVSQLREGKPLSFTSMNGEIVLRVPPDGKANVRLRTQNGAVLTDFEESVLATKTENTPAMGWGPKTTSFKGGKVITAEVQDAIREAAQIGATAVREALEAVKEGLEAARLDNDEARHDLDKAKRDLDRARRDVERERGRADRQTTRGGEASPAPLSPPVPPVPPVPPKVAGAPGPHKFAVPTITGGKLVTGTLNGGGPEISVSTMNGDVILRKLGADK